MPVLLYRTEHLTIKTNKYYSIQALEVRDLRGIRFF